jgi:hypothetical protein
MCLVAVATWLQSKTAQAALEEARGFTATTPTTELIKGKKPGSAAAATAAARHKP